MSIPNLVGAEILILLVIVLLVFGAKLIPELARSLGSGLREFRKGVSDKDEDLEARDSNRDGKLPTAEKKGCVGAGEANSRASERAEQRGL